MHDMNGPYHYTCRMRQSALSMPVRYIHGPTWLVGLLELGGDYCIPRPNISVTAMSLVMGM